MVIISKIADKFHLPGAFLGAQVFLHPADRAAFAIIRQHGLDQSGEGPVDLAVAAGVAPGPQVGQDARGHYLDTVQKVVELGFHPETAAASDAPSGPRASADTSCRCNHMLLKMGNPCRTWFRRPRRAPRH